MAKCIRLKCKRLSRLTPGLTRIKNWYHSKFQLILATYSPLIPKLCSDKSESGGKWILVSHWLRILQILRISQWETSIYFPPLSDLSEHSFGISRPNVARISWNFEWYQFFILVGPGGNRDLPHFKYQSNKKTNYVPDFSKLLIIKLKFENEMLCEKN